MSRVVNFSSALTTNVSSYSGITGSVTIAGANSGITSSANTSQYASITPSSNSSSGYAIYRFDTSEIPSNATINSVVCTARGRAGSNNKTRGSFQLTGNNTIKGTPVFYTSTTSTGYALDTGSSWIAEQARNIGIMVGAQRTGNNAGISRFYGATLTVNYTVNDTEYEVTIDNQSDIVTTVPIDSAWTFAGGNQEVKFYGIDNLSDVSVKDNNTNVTSSLVSYPGANNTAIVGTINGVTYGFATSGNGYCSTNQGRASSVSMCRLNITATSQCVLNLYVINYAEATYDYGVIGQLDTALTTVTSTTSDNYAWIGNTADKNLSTEQLVQINVPSGTHYVDFKFRKDNYTDSNNDSLWFRYELDPSVSDPYYKYTISNISADHTILIEDVGGTYYNVNASSTYTGATVSPSTQSIREGRGATVNIAVDNLYEIKVKDNNVDVTSSVTGTSGNYSYTVSNVQTAHTITVEENTNYSVTVSSTYTGATGTANPSKVYVGRSSVVEIDVDNLYEIIVKDNGVDVTSSIVQTQSDSVKATFNTSDFVSSASSYSSVYNSNNPENGETNSGSTTRAIVYSNTGSGAESKLVYKFDCSSIPQNATITSVMCYAGASCYSSGQYFQTRTLQLYNGSTAKGTATTITGNGSTKGSHTIDGGTWTREELNDISIVERITRTTSNTTTDATFSFWGADLVVSYTTPDSCTYTLNNVQANHTITIEEAPSYAITTANTYTGATISAPSSVFPGQSATITINVANLYEVIVKDNGTDVTSSCTGSNGTYRYAITSATTAHSITVEEAPYKAVTTSSNFAGATVSANPTKVYANMSSQITVSAEGLYAVRIKDNGTDITGSFTGSNGTYRYTIPSVSVDHSIVVDEAPYYSITITKNYNSCTASTSPAKIYSGMSGVTTIQVADADEIVVLDDGVNVSANLVQAGTGVYTYTITGVNANHTITINESNRYTLTASSTYTAVTITPASVEVVEGRNATFTLDGEEDVILTTDIILTDNGVDVTNQIVAAEGETGSTEYSLGTFDEDSSDYVGIYSTYVTTNAEGNSAAQGMTSTASTRSAFYPATGEGSTIKVVYNIPAGTVPNGAILTNVSCSAVCSMAYTGQGYSTATVQLYAGDTAKGEAATLNPGSAAAFVTNVNGGSSWTAQELANAKLVIYGVRNNTNSNNDTGGTRDNVSMHGATLVLEYMYPAGATYTVNNVQSAHTIIVTEVPAAYYDIIASATYTGATASPASQSIRNGRNATVNITTDYDYRILVRDNGTNVTNQLVGSDTAFTYHLTDVQSAHTIVVEEAPTYIVSAVSEYTGATIAPSSQTVYEGQTATVEIEATNINEISVLDNGTDVTEQLVFTEGGPTSSMTAYLGEFDEDSSQYLDFYTNSSNVTFSADRASGHSAAEGVESSTSASTRSAFYAESGVGDTIKIVYNIPFTGLPQGAVITNVSCDAAVSRAYAGSGYSLTTLQLFAGDTAKGDPVEFTTPMSYAIIVNVDGGSQWTQSELANAKIVMYGVRNSTTNGYNRDNLSFHGADLIVTYGDGTSFNGYIYTTDEIHERHDIVITEIEQFTVNASSTVQGVTITPTSTTVNARTNVTITINGDISEVEILDNGIEISSQLTEVNATSHTYTIWSITTGHTVVVTAPSNEHDYIKVDDEFKQIKNYYKKINGVWTLISKDAFSGYITTNVSVFGGKYEVRTIGTVTESSTDFINISINDGALSSGTYTLIYEDANHNPIEHVDKITQFTIN